ncbi:variant erythrocyte surface antigen-1 family protein [Babesia caballi]|uniref:Variant erythrocyte surface antigen-1 family protein n=1 Tax=Babesia caballi TaxID=5871 RepID=A0AAV4LS03_BABCB|nr:variant erythrocyte surface antigen-1 family protein [Babesia caballi]
MWISLAQGITGLPGFTDAIKAAAEKLQESEGDYANTVFQALQKLQDADTVKGIIGKLADGLATFIGYDGQGKIGANKGIGNSKNYTESAAYKKGSAEWSNVEKTKDKEKCAQIFLGCLPLYYYWLTYIYWKCRENGGDWASEISNRPTLLGFMSAHGYFREHISRRKASDIAKLLEVLDTFKQSMQTVSDTPPTTIKPSHPEFLNALNKSLQGAFTASVGSSTITSVSFNNHSLSALFYLCRCYFTGKHIMQSGSPTSKPRPPTSIREMLYWLSGLQFSPHYSDIEKQIETIIPQGSGLPVADSAMTTANNIITQSQMKGFLLSSCLSAPGVLGAIQGNSADTDEGEPWLYSLFCNTMNLHYPSGAALFNTLANYSYALQFQLYFLYIQCRTNYSQSYGWQWCRYGQSAQPSGKNAKELASWICSSSNCLNISCQHNSDRCQHIKECGQSGQPSPLQAFLTDNLKGFHVSFKPSPSSPNHLENHPPGSMCHVKMGFASALTKDANATGWYIYYLLEHFCGFTYGPLRQLSEKLGCLTRRTPRTLGDIFGFVWHLNGQLFKNKRPKLKALIEKFLTDFNINSDLANTFINEPYSVLTKIWSKIAEINSTHSSHSNPTVLSKSLEAMAPAIPFLYQLFMAKDPNTLPGALFDLTQHCHKLEVTTTHTGSRTSANTTVIKHKNGECSQINDLWSLYQPVGQKPSGTDTQPECRLGTCGGYFSPLTHSDGATYTSNHASAYFSWVLYLADDLYEQLDRLKMSFEDLKCSNCTGTCKNIIPDCHISSNRCSCPSVVQCSGVLPLLYANGFNFASASSLSGWRYDNSRWTQDGANKRSCQQFHAQLTAVLAKNETTPLFKLLTTIDDFLYMFRVYFFYNLSTFWIIPTTPQIARIFPVLPWHTVYWPTPNRRTDRIDEAHQINVFHAITHMAVTLPNVSRTVRHSLVTLSDTGRVHLIHE